jgi:positive regulator of sigma E activity
MKEKGIVLDKEQEKTKIRIFNPELCSHCNVRFFCVGKKSSDDTILVENNIGAEPGDEVEFDVPVKEYNKELIKMFGFLLLGIVGGAIGGYNLSPFLSIAKELTILITTIFGLGIMGIFVVSNFKKKYNSLFPTITRIIKKGEKNG